MARTIDEIYQQIITAKNSKPELDSLSSTSKVAIYNTWAYITAVVIWTLENLFDLHKKEIDDALALLKPHSPRWYRQKALAFQFGQNLVPETDRYDNTGLTEEQIEARKIVKYSAVTEIEGKVRIKVATEADGEPAPLEPTQVAAFRDYIAQLKDAGVRVVTDSLPPDSLYLVIDVWYNPLVLSADGARIDGADLSPVKTAIKNYLKSLPFNGEYANTRLVDAIQAVDGVVYPNIKTAQAKYGLFPFSQIDEKYIPDAGYLEVTDANLKITYREYV